MIHPRERIIEIIYPERPTVEAFERYEKKLKEAIKALKMEFDCIVDQRAPILASPELAERMVSLTKWAEKHGMRRLVRVIAKSASAALQAKRIAKEASIAAPTVAKETREEAFEWLARHKR